MQLYLYDTENEINNLLKLFSSDGVSNLDSSIVGSLSTLLHSTHAYVHLFRTARDISSSKQLVEYSVRFYVKTPSRYDTASSPKSLGAIVTGDDANADCFDVIVHSHEGHPKRISRLHPCYMPLQYPLLFPYGEDGWSADMR
ncbi:hypothetical protein LXL04_022367 [Taraxacum kok-saghyz]